ncbi:leucine-rich repeat-containing G-protein coupled receptor 4-like [Rhopalosiphum maidis]|uniref:leucine-rich repeat-containing G-protein coupled receptor 4-like n=1 Tax=Rhopalosiphum maidis TaxID=43146 RepID=UPI000EFEE0C5|nr:leucine-rich repeat-containing G-protein coupled receptor 4-like [Rhopalosiphum maidis]
MVVILNAIVVSLLSIVVAKIQKECVLELPTNGSRDVYCDVIPYKVDLNHTNGMTKLDISQNNLNGIFIFSDKNMTLPTLDVSRNNIRSPCHVAISNIVSVDSMILSFNKIYNFSICSDIRNLTLSWNYIRSLNKTDMVNASSLEVLDLGNNFILWIENNTFIGMPDLQWLDLRGNALTRISEKTLPSTTLRYLDVSENYDLDRTTVFQPFENLVELNIAKNAELAPVVLGSGPRLQALDASHTNLTEVPVTPAPLLGSLILSGNAIKTVNSGDLDGFPLLRLLNISANRIKIVEDDAFGRLDLLIVLDLSDNLLKTVPKSLPESLEKLNLEGNRIQNLGVEDFEGCKGLKILNVRKNNIQHIQDLTFASLLFLDTLDLSENPIKMITREMLAGPVKLKVLKLERLIAPETPTFPFTDTRYLNRIQLAYSKHLAKILLNDSAVLSSMFQLEYLDLTECDVISLPKRLPYHMPKIKTLILNELKCIESWLKDWLCEIYASEDKHYKFSKSELRLRNYQLKKFKSSVESVQCRQENGNVQQVFDAEYCAIITTISTYRVTTITTEQAAVFARLRAKDDPKNSHVVAKSNHPGMIVFVCIVLLLVLLASGTVWVGMRGDTLKRLHWRQNIVDVVYQSIEIKSLESLSHVERW